MSNKSRHAPSEIQSYDFLADPSFGMIGIMLHRDPTNTQSSKPLLTKNFKNYPSQSKL